MPPAIVIQIDVGIAIDDFPGARSAVVAVAIAGEPEIGERDHAAVFVHGLVILAGLATPCCGSWRLPWSTATAEINDGDRKRTFQTLADLQFEQVDDFFGIRSLNDEGADVPIWCYPLVEGEPVYHHPGPFDGVRLDYNILRNPARRAEHYLHAQE